MAHLQKLRHISGLLGRQTSRIQLQSLLRNPHRPFTTSALLLHKPRNSRPKPSFLRKPTEPASLAADEPIPADFVPEGLTAAQWEEAKAAEQALKKRLRAADVAVGVIVVTCMMICGLHWVYEKKAAKGDRTARARLVDFGREMVLSWRNVQEGRWYTVLTSTVTHVEPWHLVVNMMMLWSFGRTIMMIYGMRTFGLLWVGSAISGGAAHLYYRRNTHIDQGAVGSSGSLCGMAATLACAAPFMEVRFVIIPMSLGTAMLGTTIGSIVCIQQGWLQGFGHADHLGGIAFGALFWLLVLRRPGHMLGKSIMK